MDTKNRTETPAWGTRVTAASRLSFTLIDLNGASGRRNGMASLSLRDPGFRGTVRSAAEFQLETDSHSSLHAEAIRVFFQRLQDEWAVPPVSVSIEQGLPAHSGFGSKTTTLLSLGKAAALHWGRETDTEELARLARRGGTSGASVNLIDRGGFLVDGGHANPADFESDPHHYLLPSRFAGAARRAPALINLSFPSWPILVFITNGIELSGKPELDWFRRTLPIPEAEAHRTAHLVLMNLAPAIAERDYEGFCRALDRLTFATHYKQQQIAIQPKPVQDLLNEARKRPELDAVGISVTGPMCFAFTRTPSAATDWMRSWQEAGVVRSFFFTNAQNHPVFLENVPA